MWINPTNAINNHAILYDLIFSSQLKFTAHINSNDIITVYDILLSGKIASIENWVRRLIYANGVNIISKEEAEFS